MERGYKNKEKQEVSDDLSVCVLDFLPQVSTLPGLLAIILVTVEILNSQTATWFHISNVIKGSGSFKDRNLLTVSQHVALFGVHRLLQVEI